MVEILHDYTLYSIYSVEDLRQAILSLSSIARSFKERRTQAGAVDLDSVEVKVQISEEKDTKKIENLIPKQVINHCPFHLHDYPLSLSLAS